MTKPGRENPSYQKITLDAEKAWVIRSVRTKPAGEIITSYYETPSTWNRAAALGTIFRSYETAEAHLTMFVERDVAPRGWADGSKEVLDVVPLYGAVVGPRK